MNPRTQQLFNTALDTAVPETWTTLSPQQLIRFADKFSELILNEHIDVLRREWYTLNNLPEQTESDARSVAIRVGKKGEVVALIHKLKKHFESTP